MKVPTLTSTRTTSVGASQAFVQGTPSQAGAIIGKSLNNLGNEFAQLRGQLKQRDDQITKFNTLRDFSEFETSVAADLTTLKRDYAADGKGFTDTADMTYDRLETQFLNEHVPQELQAEFRMRSGEVKQRVLTDAMSFQYQAGDAWYKQGVADQLNKSKSILDQNPAALADQQSKVMAAIDATDLPEIEKENLKRSSNIALASVQYKARVRSEVGAADSLGVGPISGGASGAASILRKEEGFRPTPYWDVNHDRVGYGSDTVTLADGTVKTTTKGMAISRADAERDLARRIGLAEKEAQEKVGAELWNGQPANVQAGVISVIYNYGNLPPTVATALKSGSTEEVANAVAALGSGNKRRQREASIIRGTAGIESDPQYDIIPYEDKVALREDAGREAAAAATAAKAQAKAERDAAQNNLYLGLLDGNKGQVDIDNARIDGTLNDYESVNKAANILKERDKEGNLAAAAIEKLNTPGSAWDPTDTDSKKMLNALVGKNGLSRINQGDQSYITDGIVPLVSQTGDVPTDVAGSLTGMLRGNNNQSAMFALDAMAQLQDTNEAAFNQRFDSDTSQAVDLWQARKDITPKEELLSMVRGGTTQAERQAKMVLRKEAQDILSRSENGVPVLRNLMSQVTESFDGWTYSANNYTAPVAQQSLAKEFQTQFVDAYSKTGDTATAVEMAQKELKRTWDVTDVGSGKVLMKYPPEKVGYKPLAGSYDWINEQARADLGLTPEQNFQLFSDEQTRQEVNAFKQNPDAAPPSYRIFTIDENGVARERVNDRGIPERLNFKPPAEAIQKDNDLYDWRAEKAALEEQIQNYRIIRAGAEVSGKEVPEEDTAEFEAAQQNLEALIKADPRTKGLVPDQGTTPFSNFDTETGLPRQGVEFDQPPTSNEISAFTKFFVGSGSLKEALAISLKKPDSYADREGAKKMMEIRDFLFGQLAEGKTLKEVLAISRDKPASYEDRN